MRLVTAAPFLLGRLAGGVAGIAGCLLLGCQRFRTFRSFGFELRHHGSFLGRLKGRGRLGFTLGLGSGFSFALCLGGSFGFARLPFGLALLRPDAARLDDSGPLGALLRQIGVLRRSAEFLQQRLLGGSRAGLTLFKVRHLEAHSISLVMRSRDAVLSTEPPMK